MAYKPTVTTETFACNHSGNISYMAIPRPQHQLTGVWALAVIQGKRDSKLAKRKHQFQKTLKLPF
jgi:hypothetical protein